MAAARLAISAGETRGSASVFRCLSMRRAFKANVLQARPQYSCENRLLTNSAPQTVQNRVTWSRGRPARLDARHSQARLLHRTEQ